mgnify:CR=1 FL=1
MSALELALDPVWIAVGIAGFAVADAVVILLYLRFRPRLHDAIVRALLGERRPTAERQP